MRRIRRENNRTASISIQDRCFSDNWTEMLSLCLLSSGPAGPAQVEDTTRTPQRKPGEAQSNRWRGGGQGQLCEYECSLAFVCRPPLVVSHWLSCVCTYACSFCRTLWTPCSTSWWRTLRVTTTTSSCLTPWWVCVACVYPDDIMFLWLVNICGWFCVFWVWHHCVVYLTICFF